MALGSGGRRLGHGPTREQQQEHSAEERCVSQHGVFDHSVNGVSNEPALGPGVRPSTAELGSGVFREGGFQGHRLGVDLQLVLG
jgi:hypothetical protein